MMSIMRRAAYAAGMMIRETGQALDRAGSRLQGSYAFTEQCKLHQIHQRRETYLTYAVSRHRQVMNLKESKPIISSDVFLAPSASLVGNVEVHPSASVWYGAVIRADTAPIQIGERASIGDRAVIRGASSIGTAATVSPGAVVDGAALGDGCVIGPGAVVMPGASIGTGAVIRAGSYVAEGITVASDEIWGGAPAVRERALSEEEKAEIEKSAQNVVALAGAHAVECGKTHEQIEAEKLRQRLLDERSDDYNSHLGLIGREREIIEVQARFIENDREEQRKVGAG